MAFCAADMSSSVAMEQTHASVASTNRGFRYQIVPDSAGDRVPGAVAVQVDEVRVVAGSRSAAVSRSRVGADAASAAPDSAAFGLLVSGRHPASSVEATLSEASAARLAAAIGDRVRLGARMYTVVGIFALPANPEWLSIAGLADPAVERPTAWLTDQIPEDLGDSGYRVNSIEFQTMLAAEAIDAGLLGFVRYFRPAFTVLAACLFGFMVMLFHSGVSTEYRGLAAAGMSARQAHAVVALACAFSATVGAFVGSMVVALVFHLAPQAAARPWGMRWLDVPVELPPATTVFILTVACVALLLPARRALSRRSLRPRPLPRFVGWLALIFCTIGVAMVAYPCHSRADVARNWWLALVGVAMVSLAVPFAFAARTRQSNKRALTYISKQRARRALAATLMLTLIAFVATSAATKYAHFSKVNEAWYRAPQPTGSLAVREVPNPGALQRLAGANPGDEFSTRGDSSGLLVVSPSLARRIGALSPPIDEERIDSCDMTGEGVGSIGEPAEVWRVSIRPDERTALADPSFIEDGHIVIGRLRRGRFVRLSTATAVPTQLLGGGGGFPSAVVDSLARYGGKPSELRSIALLDFADLPSADQGQLEGLARSIAPTAFVEADLGYRDGGFYAFSEFVGYGAALLVALIAIGFGLQLISEERELRHLMARSDSPLARRRVSGALAFVSITTPIAVAAVAGLWFTRDTGRPEIPQFGHTALAFVLAAVIVTAALGLLHASSHGEPGARRRL